MAAPPPRPPHHPPPQRCIGGFGPWPECKPNPRDRCSQDVASEVDQMARAIAMKISTMGNTNEDYAAIKRNFEEVENSLEKIKAYVKKRKEEVDAMFNTFPETVKCPKRGCLCVFPKEGGSSFHCAACKGNFCNRHIELNQCTNCVKNIVCENCSRYKIMECTGHDGQCPN